MKMAFVFENANDFVIFIRNHFSIFFRRILEEVSHSIFKALDLKQNILKFHADQPSNFRDLDIYIWLHV